MLKIDIHTKRETYRRTRLDESPKKRKEKKFTFPDIECNLSAKPSNT